MARDCFTFTKDQIVMETVKKVYSPLNLEERTNLGRSHLANACGIVTGENRRREAIFREEKCAALLSVRPWSYLRAQVIMQAAIVERTAGRVIRYAGRGCRSVDLCLGKH